MYMWGVAEKVGEKIGVGFLKAGQKEVWPLCAAQVGTYKDLPF